MAGWAADRLIGDARGRSGALVAASVLMHAVVLGWLSWQALGLDERYRQGSFHDPLPLFIEMEPRPLLKGEKARPRQSSEPAAPTAATAMDRIVSSPAPDAVGSPSPPAPRLTTPVAGVETPDDPWRVRSDQVPGDMADGVGRGLRGGAGCRRAYDRLSAAEQAACDQRTAAAADRAPPITGSGDARRDAAFAAQGARALAEYEARRRPLSGGTGVLTAADCPGSNFGTGCAGAHMPSVPGVDMRQGATTTHNGGQRSDKQQ